MVVPTSTLSFNGRSIVITRPAQQSYYLQSKLSAQGAVPLLFPCIEIKPLDLNSGLNKLPITLADTDIFIFISVNAVQLGLPIITTLLEEGNLDQKTVAAIGQSTEAKLTAAGVKTVLTPSLNYDSEGLLELPEMKAVRNKSIIVIKGEGGRTLLFNQLNQRGAHVYALDVYTRTIPRDSNLDIFNNQIDAILFTSSESVENMLRIVPVSLHKKLFGSQPIVGHSRIATKVTSLGFKKLPIIAANPSDAEMLAAAQDWVIRMEKNNEH